MMRCTIEDAEHINYVLSHDAVWPYIIDDGEYNKHDVGEFYLNVPSVWVISPCEGVVFILIPRNSITFELHTAMLPDMRGIYGIRKSREALSWAWDNMPMRKIISWIPEPNRAALMFSQIMGFKREGFSPDSWVKDGVLYGMHLVGKER